MITLIQESSENKSGTSYFQLQMDNFEKKDYFFVSKANNKLISIGMVHTHPLLPIDVKGKRNEAEMSEEDLKSAKSFVMVDMRLQIYSKNPINISKAFPNGTQKINFQTYGNILNDSFNIFLDALDIYFKWHK